MLHNARVLHAIFSAHPSALQKLLLLLLRLMLLHGVISAVVSVNTTCVHMIQLRILDVTCGEKCFSLA